MHKIHRDLSWYLFAAVVHLISTSAFGAELSPQEKAMNAYDQTYLAQIRELSRCGTEECKRRVNSQFVPKRLSAQEALRAAGIEKYPGPSQDRVEAYLAGKPDPGRKPAAEQTHGQEGSRTPTAPEAHSSSPSVAKDNKARKNVEAPAPQTCKPEKKEKPGYSSGKRPSVYEECKETMSWICNPAKCGKVYPGGTAAEAQQWLDCTKEKCELPNRECTDRVYERIAEYDESQKARRPMNCCIVGAKQICAPAN